MSLSCTGSSKRWEYNVMSVAAINTNLSLISELKPSSQGLKQTQKCIQVLLLTRYQSHGTSPHSRFRVRVCGNSVYSLITELVTSGHGPLVRGDQAPGAPVITSVTRTLETRLRCQEPHTRVKTQSLRVGDYHLEMINLGLSVNDIINVMSAEPLNCDHTEPSGVLIGTE